MPQSQDGLLIQTISNNIHLERDPTPDEINLANSLAPEIRAAGRNWIPVFVLERKTNDYLLIGSPVVYEAAKRAEIKFISCIQIHRRQEDLKSHIDRITKPSESSGLTPSVVDIMPLVTRIEQLESGYQGLGSAINKVIAYFMPEEILDINHEEKELLTRKLLQISGLGIKSVSKISEDILKYRPFKDEFDLRDKVCIIGFPKKKSKPEQIPQADKLFKALKTRYRLLISNEIALP